MTFVESTPPDITDGIPLALARAREAARVFISTGMRFDVVIGGVPFFVAATDGDPYQRQTAPYKKDQIDTSKEPGEQTLDGYWIRSQTSWHMGAGIRYYEPGSDPLSEYRFESSQGVDVWTKDKVSLLKKMVLTNAVASGECWTTGAIIGGAGVFFTNQNGTLARRSATGALVATYTGISTMIGPAAVTGATVLAGCATGIYSGSTTGSSVAALWTQASGTAPVPYWAKSRIIATRGTSIYDLTMAGGNLDTATPLHTHPDANWIWTDVTEGPDAIYASGYANGYGAIYRFTLQDATSGSVPKLGQAYQVSELPRGEEVHAIKVSLGRFMGIGTSRGMRVALIDANANLAVGPLLFQTTNPVEAITAGDKFLYCVVNNDQPDGMSGAARIDLSEQIGTNSLQYGSVNSLRFPYAMDARLGVTGKVTSIAMVGAGPQLSMACQNSGIYIQSPTVYEDSGYVISGRVRYATVEPKLFRSIKVGASVAAGTVISSLVDTDGDELYLRTQNSRSDSDDISLDTANGTNEFLRFKFALGTEAGKTDQTPVVNSLQIRALPVPRRQRLIQFPLLVMDFEQSPTGTRIGCEGYAITRLRALETVEEKAVVVLVQDFATDETYEAVIEQVAFKRPGPTSTDGRHNFGGFAMVTVRKL